MPRPALSTLPIVLVATVLLATTSHPAGDSRPTIIRAATIDGVRGPAYYSIVDGRFRAVSQPERKMAELSR